MIFLTSDTHFGHGRILELSHRPFDSIEQHDDEIVRRWNEVVGPKDTVIHLGDVAWVTARLPYRTLPGVMARKF